MNSYVSYPFLVILVASCFSLKSHSEGLETHTLTQTQIEQVLKLGQKNIDGQIEEIKKSFDLELLSTTRPNAKSYFDSLGPAKKSVEDISDIEGLYGKAVCPDPKSNDSKPLIYIAKDAPPSTLLHEYMHGLQIQNKKRWCVLSGRVLENDEKKERAILFHSFEFEVLKTLWDLRDRLALNIEDKLILVEGLNRENKLFASMGIQALSPEISALVEKEFEEARLQIEFYTWLSKTPVEASSVLQKMEVIALKSCAEKTDGISETDKINKCLAKRCEYSKLSCPKVSDTELKPYDDLITKIIFAWTKPFQKSGECDLSKLKDEFINGLESVTGCWKKWYQSSSKSSSKDLHLKSLTFNEIAKRFNVPPLGIDHKTVFFEAENPKSLINRTYCYFIYQKVIRFESLPIDQFPFSVMGASMASKTFEEYKLWLSSSKNGKLCTKIVKLFTGQEPSPPNLPHGIAFMLVINPIGALTGGIPSLKDNLALDINHERLHAIFADNTVVKGKIKEEWNNLSKEEQEQFKTTHTSYDFKNEETLLKEYFSYTRQNNPRQLF